MFGLLKRRIDPVQQRGEQLYHAVVDQARLPVFYADNDVPDSFDGRFEMLTLHAWMLIHTLHEQSRPDLAQALFDSMFLDMDRSLRERGVGDLAVPKKMKKMMTGFNGRAQAYEEGLEPTGDIESALKRNVYGTREEVGEASLKQMADYITAQITRLGTLDIQNVKQKEIFTAPEEVIYKLSDKEEHHDAA